MQRAAEATAPCSRPGALLRWRQASVLAAATPGSSGSVEDALRCRTRDGRRQPARAGVRARCRNGWCAAERRLARPTRAASSDLDRSQPTPVTILVKSDTVKYCLNKTRGQEPGSRGTVPGGRASRTPCFFAPLGSVTRGPPRAAAASGAKLFRDGWRTAHLGSDEPRRSSAAWSTFRTTCFPSRRTGALRKPSAKSSPERGGRETLRAKADALNPRRSVRRQRGRSSQGARTPYG